MICKSVTPTKRTWSGYNASCWKADAFKVNRIDYMYELWIQDLDFGYRLRHCGLKLKQIRYSAPHVYLNMTAVSPAQKI